MNKARTMKGVVASVLLACLASASSGALARPTSRDPLASTVVRTLERSAAAFERGDLAAASRIWSNSESLTVFESGHVNRGWTDYRNNHLAPEMKELRGVRYRLASVVPHVAGATAWATFDYAISGRDADGRAFSGTGVGTAVLEREGGAWRIVHWHTTSTARKKPPPTPTAT